MLRGPQLQEAWVWVAAVGTHVLSSSAHMCAFTSKRAARALYARCAEVTSRDSHLLPLLLHVFSKRQHQSGSWMCHVSRGRSGAHGPTLPQMQIQPTCETP